MSYQRLVISVQRFSISISGGTTGTATLPQAVVVANTVLYPMGHTNTFSNSDSRSALGGMTLTNTTTVTGTVNTSPGASACTLYGVAVEYGSAVLRTKAQYFTIAMAAAAASGTYTISPALSAVTRGFIIPLGETYDTNGQAFESIQSALVLTNVTTVTASRVATTGALTVYGVVGEYR